MDSENNLNQETAMNKNETSLNTDLTNTESPEDMAVVNESTGWVDASPELTTKAADDIEESATKQESTLGVAEETTNTEQAEVNPNMQTTPIVETPEAQQVVAEKKKLSLTPLFALTTVAAIGALAYTIITNQTQRQQLYHDLSVSKEETKKAQEAVIKLEEATKANQTVIKENKTVESNTKTVAYDVKYQQLLDVMGEHTHIIDGQIFTNKAGTYAFASLQVGEFYKKKDNLGNDTLVVAGGSGVREYYRELPNGEWKYAFGGHMPMKCSAYPAEIRRIYHDVERPDGQNNYSCRTGDSVNDFERL